MGDGSTKAMKDIKAGDTVLATDPVTGKTRTRPLRKHTNVDVDHTV
jgi:hypothetical protein